MNAPLFRAERAQRRRLRRVKGGGRILSRPFKIPLTPPLRKGDLDVPVSMIILFRKPSKGAETLNTEVIP
jgi:hypothetical protein